MEIKAAKPDYISQKILAELPEKLQQFDEQTLTSEHQLQQKKAIAQIRSLVGDPMVFCNTFSEPRSTIEPSTLYEELHQDSGVFATLKHYFQQELSVNSNARKLFILSDAGMGRTCLLALLKLIHTLEYWPKQFDCQYLRFDETTIPKISSIKHPERSILLIDDIDHQPNSLNSDTGITLQRVGKILSLVKPFHRVIITCKKAALPAPQSSSFKSIGMLLLNQGRYPGFYLLRPGLTKDNNLYAQVEHYKQYQTRIDDWISTQILQSSLQDTPETHQDILTICVWIAELMQRQGKDEISLKVLRTLCQNPINAAHLESNPQQVIEIITAVNKAANQILKQNEAGSFEFVELTAKEFLVVKGVADGIISGQEKPFVVSDTLVEFLPGARISEPCHFVDEQGHFVLQGACLQDQDLSHIDLSYANLQGADLSGTKLSGAKMVGANLSFSKLIKTNLQAADLSSASLLHSNVYQADLQNANLTAVKLMATQLKNSKLEGANLMDVHFYTSEGELIDDSEITLAELSAKTIDGKVVETPEEILSSQSRQVQTKARQIHAVHSQPAQYKLGDKTSLLQFGSQYYDPDTHELLKRHPNHYDVVERLSEEQARYLQLMIDALNKPDKEVVVSIDELVASSSPSHQSYNYVLKSIANLRKALDKNNVYIKSFSGKGFYLTNKVRSFSRKA